MRKIGLVFFAVILLASCEAKTYDIHIEFDLTEIQEKAPVYMGGVLISIVKSINKTELGLIVTIEIPDSISLPRDTKFTLGNINWSGSKGIMISMENEMVNDQIKNNDTIKGEVIDGFIFDIEKADSINTNKVLDVFKTIIEERDTLEGDKNE